MTLDDGSESNYASLKSPPSSKFLAREKMKNGAIEETVVGKQDMERVERQLACTMRSITTVQQTYGLRQRRYADLIRKLKAEIASKKELLGMK